MKILYCTNFYTKTSGGVKTYLHSIGDELNRRGMAFRLVVPGSEDRLLEDPEKDSRIYVLRSPRFPVNREYRMILPFDFLPHFRFKLGEIIRQERPDVVEISDLWTLIYLARALKDRPSWFGIGQRPLVAGFAHDRLCDYMVHYFTASTMKNIMLRFAGWYLRTVYLPCFDLMLANSEYTADELREHMETKPGSKHPDVHVVPLGVDVKTFSPSRRDASFRLAFLSAGEGLLLLYAGRLAREKGLDRLMSTMKKLEETGRNDVRLLVIGDGSLRGWIEALNLDNVSLFGYVGERSRLAGIYASCDAFVTPSIREGFGISQLEAMASGLPVICPGVAGQMSYMGARAGIITGHSSGALLNTILKMRDLPFEERKEMGKTARMIAEQHSWKETSERILNIYREELNHFNSSEELLHHAPSPVHSIHETTSALEVE